MRDYQWAKQREYNEYPDFVKCYSWPPGTIMLKGLTPIRAIDVPWPKEEIELPELEEE